MLRRRLSSTTAARLDDVSKADIRDTLISRAKERYGQREAEIGSDLMRELERVVLLRNVDTKWMDHIDAMDELQAAASPCRHTPSGTRW